MRETQHQINIIKWSRQPRIRARWPELALLFHIKNETTEGPARVAIDRAMGVKKGVPDLCLPVPRAGFHGLFIEMKNERGRANDAQKWWLESLEKQGYMCAVCNGWEQAVKKLEDYLMLNA